MKKSVPFNSSEASRSIIYRLEEATGKSIEEILSDGIDEERLERFRRVSLIEKELGVPLPYLTGRAYFLDMELFVGPGVFIPRPETEVLLLAVLDHFKEDGPRNILDIGTGTGALAIYLARRFEKSAVTAVDISPVALRYAEANARRYRLSNVRFVLSDVFGALRGNEKFDLIVSNPPYIPRDEVRKADPSLSWEPRIALDGGADGLSVIRKIIEGLDVHLSPGGSLFLEISPLIAPSLEELLSSGRYELEYRRDLDGRIRVARIRRRYP
ncbi:MAG: peptide chain release factor N(5)-glutamine methyltransferase [Candidatus Hydrothermota bacterium]|nr:MAG: peptide chain release factor N(5)-glutamine methyltransferase [Candidatus Hydrothermae bacterium]